MKGFLSLSPPSPDGYFIRPSCITLRSPPYRRRPAKFFIGENQRHQRVVRARRKCVSSPDVLSLFLSLSFRIPRFPGDDCFPENNHFVSRCFEGRGEEERSSLVHSSHFEIIGSLFLPIEPSPHHLLLLGYYVYPRHGDRDKVAPEERGRRRCYRFTRGCIKKRFF